MDHQASAIVDLARRMETDINDRGLSAGDSYLSTAEAATAFRTSTTRANRALQLLEKRRVLIRRQRTGAIIAEPNSIVQPRAIRRVNFVVAQNYLTTEGLGADGVVAGMQKGLPNTDFQFRFIPDIDGDSAVNSLLDDALKSSHSEGFVLVRTSHAIQKAVLGSQLPTVVYGTSYPMRRAACCVDRDHHRIGYFLTDYLLQQSAKRILVLMRPNILQGDNLLLDGICERLKASEGAMPDFDFRCLPADEEVLQETLHELIKQGPTPLGILCRSEPLALATKAAISTLYPEISQRRRQFAGICVADSFRNRQDLVRFPTASIMLTYEQVGEQIGLMLQQQADGLSPTPSRYLIQTELSLPEVSEL